jgi:cell division control protein 24
MLSGLTDPIDEEDYFEQPISHTRHRSQSSPNFPQRQWDLPSLHTIPTSPLESSPLRSPSSPYMPGTVKVKVNHNDGIYAILCNTEILYSDLMEKVDRKIRLVSNIPTHEKLRLKYQDEDGDLITINSDDDVQMAFESRGNLNTVNVFVGV